MLLARQERTRREFFAAAAVCHGRQSPYCRLQARVQEPLEVINMLNPTPRTVFLKDYTPPPFLISDVQLDVHVDAEGVGVEARLTIRRNPKFADPRAPLVLDGDELELQ